ncbi:tRNA (guanosine(46)-N7)-methyltransferase TrmB [Nesterenkonia alkaliphila]|uniref:tRNA (guanine-N(7)-)-methyltransferase n=1 Tax=Nesterenkonia alkaliphila TaxID=1463631 RepID=A0A7K1UKI4_9MICC|nr:tRNA (guanosine(46)-N7)-methyltransferase TrmB [Nesterenkonia alkaliphila]MVT26936.1 tRNA (guanosine(46)-N7)-methyltransferase TrmB [Nesterenkonia alkaliphila]GFZ90518.1 tRNA (guanine-N(7)-)-methyltransferase [Nesterenkonia alkaliphila]
MAETEQRHHRKPLSFVRRSNRLKPSYQRAWDTALGRELLDVPTGDRDTAVAEGFSIDWAAEYGRRAPLIVEIGSGSGEAVAAAAAHNPDTDFLAIEVYRPGAAQLASRIRREGLSNVRVACLDAVEVLDKLLPAASVAELWVFFPDPWHKSKHKKRRLVQPLFVEKAARVIAPTGVWRLATDWADYAVQMREVIGASDLFGNPHAGEQAGEQSPLTAVRLGDLDAASLGKPTQPLPLAEALDHEGGWAPRFAARVVTDFEQKALEAGRRIFDLTYLRRP